MLHLIVSLNCVHPNVLHIPTSMKWQCVSCYFGPLNMGISSGYYEENPWNSERRWTTHFFFGGGGNAEKRNEPRAWKDNWEMRKSPTPAKTYCTHTHTQNIHSLTHTCTSICTKLKSSGAAGSCASALMCVKQSATCVHACVYAVA